MTFYRYRVRCALFFRPNEYLEECFTPGFGIQIGATALCSYTVVHLHASSTKPDMSNGLWSTENSRGLQSRYPINIGWKRAKTNVLKRAETVCTDGGWTSRNDPKISTVQICRRPFAGELFPDFSAANLVAGSGAKTTKINRKAEKANCGRVFGPLSKATGR